MTFVSVAFFILELVLIGLSVFKGYRRGLGKSLIRMIYLIIIGLVSFFLGRSLSYKLSSALIDFTHSMLPNNINDLFTVTPELDILLGNLFGALMIPIMFALLFLLLQLFSLLFFDTISGGILKRIFGTEEKYPWSKWVGAAMGLIGGIFVSAILLMPAFEVIYIVEKTPDNTITIFENAYADNVVSSDSADASNQTALNSKVPAHDVNFDFKSSFDVTKISPLSVALLRGLTSYTVPASVVGVEASDVAVDTVTLFLEIGGDALYAYNVTAHSGGTANDALTNAGSSLIPYLAKSSTVKHISADLLRTFGQKLEEDGQVLGLEFPAPDDEVIQSIVTKLIHTLATTTTDTVEANMIALFSEPTFLFVPGEEEPHVPANHGLLALMSKMDKEDPLHSLSDEDSKILTQVVGDMAEHENMSDVLDDIRDYAIDKIEDSEIDLADSEYQQLCEDINEELTSKINTYLKQDNDIVIKEISADLAPNLTEIFVQHEIPLTELETNIVSTCIVEQFLKDEYRTEDGRVSVSSHQILDFFGIPEERIPDWAK